MGKQRGNKSKWAVTGAKSMIQGYDLWLRGESLIFSAGESNTTKFGLVDSKSKPSVSMKGRNMIYL